MSGSASCPWTINSKNDARELLFEHALKCGWKKPENGITFTRSLLKMQKAVVVSPFTKFSCPKQAQNDTPKRNFQPMMKQRTKR